jgi:hypothetical protein
MLFITLFLFLAFFNIYSLELKNRRDEISHTAQSRNQEKGVQSFAAICLQELILRRKKDWGDF